MAPSGSSSLPPPSTAPRLPQATNAPTHLGVHKVVGGLRLEAQAVGVLAGHVGGAAPHLGFGVQVAQQAVGLQLLQRLLHGAQEHALRGGGQVAGGGLVKGAW